MNLVATVTLLGILMQTAPVGGALKSGLELKRLDTLIELAEVRRTCNQIEGSLTRMDEGKFDASRDQTLTRLQLQLNAAEKALGDLRAGVPGPPEEMKKRLDFVESRVSSLSRQIGDAHKSLRDYFRQQLDEARNDEKRLVAELKNIQTQLDQPSGPVIVVQSVFLPSASVISGGDMKGVITLSSAAPPTGAVVSLSSSSAGVAKVPVTVAVPAGATSVAFDVSGGAVSSDQPVTISASYGGKSAQASLVVVKIVAPIPAISPVAIAQPPAVLPKAGELKIGEKDRQQYVFVPAGSFRMGCVTNDKNCDKHDEFPAHRVTLTKEFWLGATEVTVQAYQAYSQASGVRMPDPPYSKKNWMSTADPISNVSYNDAAGYCGWAGGRLPSEAEWEYAARAGSSTVYSWGDDTADLHEHANYLGTSKDPKKGKDKFELAANVGSFPPNAWRIYDMLGNVAEFVADYYAPYGEGAVSDPRGPDHGDMRIVRGGSYAGNAGQLRVSARERVKPEGKGNFIGFRCVLEVSPR